MEKWLGWNMVFSLTRIDECEFIRAPVYDHVIPDMGLRIEWRQTLPWSIPQQDWARCYVILHHKYRPTSVWNIHL